MSTTAQVTAGREIFVQIVKFLDETGDFYAVAKWARCLGHFDSYFQCEGYSPHTFFDCPSCYGAQQIRVERHRHLDDGWIRFTGRDFVAGAQGEDILLDCADCCPFDASSPLRCARLVAGGARDDAEDGPGDDGDAAVVCPAHSYVWNPRRPSLVLCGACGATHIQREAYWITAGLGPQTPQPSLYDDNQPETPPVHWSSSSW